MINWFKQPSLWSRLWRDAIFTKGNDTTNSIESHHITLKRALPGAQRKNRIIQVLLAISWSRVENDVLSTTLASVKTPVRPVDNRIADRISGLTSYAAELEEY